jgi:hypothetical protein
MTWYANNQVQMRAQNNQAPTILNHHNHAAISGLPHQACMYGACAFPIHTDVAHYRTSVHRHFRLLVCHAHKHHISDTSVFAAHKTADTCAVGGQVGHYIIKQQVTSPCLVDFQSASPPSFVFFLTWQTIPRLRVKMLTSIFVCS